MTLRGLDKFLVQAQFSSKRQRGQLRTTVTQLLLIKFSLIINYFIHCDYNKLIWLANLRNEKTETYNELGGVICH